MCGYRDHHFKRGGNLSNDVGCVGWCTAELLYYPTVVVVVVVLRLRHRYNAVRGHRTGSSNSGAEDYLRRNSTHNN